MRLPQHNLKSICFLLENPSELFQAMGDQYEPVEQKEIERLFSLGLPPVTSKESLCVMLGYNPGFIWSLLNRTSRYYRHFEIPKGSKTRKIDAPKVALKAIQKWLGLHIQNVWKSNDHVYGFVSGRSHIDAAIKHLSATWVYSIDIENYFPSISSKRVKEALKSIGYSTEESLELLAKLLCLRGYLVQGSPSSPIISNIVLQKVDAQLSAIAAKYGCVYTRYADDIVFSGTEPVSDKVFEEIQKIVIEDGWKISKDKVSLSVLPKRLKVHGLLVHGDKVRLTKGYRNRIRAYEHLLKNDKIIPNDLSKVKGHLNYASQIRGLD